MDKERLVFIQEKLRKKLILDDKFSELRSVGGADLSYSGDSAYCTIPVLSYEDMEPIEERTTKSRVSFPYIPTFLSFREAGPLIKTFRALSEKPDVLIIDGQGIAHPRGIGLASHAGVLLDMPTIGVAKRVLVGEFLPPRDVGEAEKMVFKGRDVGFALKSTRRSRPIFVSPGHRVSLATSLKIVKTCLQGHKLPEPVRLAHISSKQAAKG
ncbi:MAG: endonuclease V [Candidatus Hydrothermarchaeales archaeon]